MLLVIFGRDQQNLETEHKPDRLHSRSRPTHLVVFSALKVKFVGRVEVFIFWTEKETTGLHINIRPTHLVIFSALKVKFVGRVEVVIFRTERNPHAYTVVKCLHFYNIKFLSEQLYVGIWVKH